MLLIAALLIAGVVSLPFQLAKLAIGNRAVPLQQRSLTRATVATFVLTFLIVTATSIRLDPAMTEAALGVGAVALLFLVAGVRNSRGMQLDVIEVVIWGFGAVCCAGLRLGMLFPPGLSPFVRALLAALYCAGCAACVVRVWLMLRPVPPVTLPDPATVPGMPMAGPASLGAAQAAMSRRGGAARPKFRTKRSRANGISIWTRTGDRLGRSRCVLSRPLLR
jgi:hypothetical protein